MVSIEPINSVSQQKSFVTKNKQKSYAIQFDKDNIKTLAYTFAGLTLLGAATFAMVKARKKLSGIKPSSFDNALCSESTYYPKDVEYRKELARACGIGEDKACNLRSIIGQEEYKNIVKEFDGNPIYYMPGDTLLTDVKDNYKLYGKDNKTFRVTMHMHTTYSDGKMSVKELLDKSAEYADEIVKTIKKDSNFKASQAPFTIAITDHDSVGGCREAVKIIADSPEKYKNLRVILGCEVTVENRLLGDELKSPVMNHIVVNGINPFDKDIEQFFVPKRELRIAQGKKVFEECLNRIKELDSEAADGLSYQDAINFDKPLKTGVLNPYFSLKIYFTNKIKSKFNNKERVSLILDECAKKANKLLPTMKKNEMEINIIDLFELFKDKEGYFTWAHPALTTIGDSLKNPEASMKSMIKLFNLFKTIAGEKALAAEIYYPYFGDVAQSKEWLELMEKAALENNLYRTGGLDTHGKSIFYSKKN